MFPAKYFPIRYFPPRYFLSGGDGGTVSTVGNFYKHTTDIYISTGENGNWTSANTYRLNVKDFSFNQPSVSVLVSRETLDPLQARTVKPYVTAMLPVEVTFTTYVCPRLAENSPNYVTSPEEKLWISLLGADAITSDASSSEIDFADGNVQTLQNLSLWFQQPNQNKGNYRISDVVVDSATINFDINNLATIEWKCRGIRVILNNSAPSHTDMTGSVDFLKTKLSTLELSMLGTSYDVALVGGGITINNNNTFYGRSRVGQVTVPEGSYTGNRVIGGDLDLYFKAGNNTSVDLYNTILSAARQATYENLYEATITINIGGEIGNYLTIAIPAAILDVGELQFENVFKVNLPFTAKEDSGYTKITYFMQ